MSRALPWRTLLPLAYILLATGFLTLHFAREKPFSALVGEIEVRGKSTIGTLLSPPKIRKLTVKAAGLELLFSKLNATILTTEDGIRHRLAIDGWSNNRNSVSIILSDGAGIKVTSSEHDRVFSLDTVIPATIPPVQSLEFHLQPASNADVATRQSDILITKLNSTEYLINLPSNSFWDPKLRRLIVNSKIDTPD